MTESGGGEMTKASAEDDGREIGGDPRRMRREPGGERRGRGGRRGAEVTEGRAGMRLKGPECEQGDEAEMTRR